MVNAVLMQLIEKSLNSHMEKGLRLDSADNHTTNL